MEWGPIRPPSEAASLYLRLTRNCPWNRCRFCHIYKGQRFSRRSVEEIKEDIREARHLADRIKELSWAYGHAGEVTPEVVQMAAYRLGEQAGHIAIWLYHGAKTVFLQDANSLVMSTDDLVEVLDFLRENFSQVERITTYARAKTLARKPVEDLGRLREAGLTRVHVGLETGYDPLLEYVQKGVTAAEQIEGGRRAKAAGLELSEYVMPGLGGRAWWREHALGTAEVLNAVDADFIRFRTLALIPSMPLYEELAAGRFEVPTEDEMVREIRLLIEHLDGITSYVVSDHSLNLLMELEGRLPEAKPELLATIDRYLSLPEEERQNFRLGRRLGVYRQLDDLQDYGRRRQVQEVLARLAGRGADVEQVVVELRNRCI
ncbi:MAG: radical SAM protein [Clostridia bacterium]|jgi:biotin synthase-like enzyme|nr:radical SAM protein [Clostridia bacterium]MDH7574101.1 radical SAM protein [Clostridia bacterium]